MAKDLSVRAPPDDRRGLSTIADDNQGSATRARADDATAGDLGNDHYVRGNARGRRRNPVHREEFGCHPRALDLFMDRVIETVPYLFTPVYFLAPAVGNRRCSRVCSGVKGWISRGHA